MTGLPEWLIVIIIVAVLSATGLWPKVSEALRELRGESTPPSGATRSGDIELCCRLLGVSPSAEWAEIEKAYRRKAKLHHPDLGGDDDTMRALNEAYARLKKARTAK